LEYAAEEASRQGRSEESAQALISGGIALALGGDLDGAEKLFGRILDPEAWPGEEPLWEPAFYHRKVGEAFLAAGMEVHAVRHFSSSLASDGDGLAEIERLCQDRGGRELVEKIHHQKEAIKQERAEDCARRGLELVAQGKLREAEAEYHRGLELDPESGRLFFNLGRLHARLGEEADALASMVSAARFGLARSDWELVVEAARFFAGCERMQQALGLLSAVKEQAPDYAPALELLQALQKPSLAGAEDAGEIPNGSRV